MEIGLINAGFCPVRELVFCNKSDRIRGHNFGAEVAERANNSKSIINDINVINIFLFHFPFLSLRHSIIFLIFNPDG